MVDTHVLKNLHNLIRNASLKYTGEFVWQDVELTNDFKKAYTNYLEKNGYTVEFFDYSAVITTSLSRYIFVPNQWFVIASYAVGVYQELVKYKEYYKDISDKLNKKFDLYTRQLRDSATMIDKKEFMTEGQKIVANKNPKVGEDAVTEAVERLWRFVNDYSWWSGQKTIDRADFYVSVVLNMLNLVNVSQGYVADIVNAYASDFTLGSMVKNLDGFTINMVCNIEDKDICSIDLYEENQGEKAATIIAEAEKKYSANPDTGKFKLKISNSRNKEIKYK